MTDPKAPSDDQSGESPFDNDYLTDSDSEFLAELDRVLEAETRRQVQEPKPESPVDQTREEQEELQAFEPEAEPDLESEQQLEQELALAEEADPYAQSGSGVELEPEQDLEGESQPDFEPESELDRELELELQKELEPDSRPDSEPVTNRGEVSDAEPVPEREFEEESEPGMERESRLGADSDLDRELELELEPGLQSEPDTVIDLEKELEPLPDVDAGQEIELPVETVSAALPEAEGEEVREPVPEAEAAEQPEEELPAPEEALEEIPARHGAPEEQSETAGVNEQGVELTRDEEEESGAPETREGEEESTEPVEPMDEAVAQPAPPVDPVPEAPAAAGSVEKRPWDDRSSPLWVGAAGALALIGVVVGGAGLYRAAGVDGRLDRLEAVAVQPHTVEESSATEENARRIGDLEHRLDRELARIGEELKGVRSALNERLEQDMSGLTSTLGALQDQLKAAEEMAARADERLQQVEKSPAEPPVQQRPSKAAAPAKPAKPTPKAVGKSEKSGGWAVNLWSFQRREKAEEELARTRAQGIPAEVYAITTGGKEWHRVAVGGFGSFAEAKAYADTIRSKPGMGAAWVGRN